MACEFIESISERIIEQLKTLGVSQDAAAMVAAEVTGSVVKDYAGERVYIGKTPHEAEQKMSERNRTIIREWKSGERAALLARRHGISIKRIRQIVMG